MQAITFGAVTFNHEESLAARWLVQGKTRDDVASLTGRSAGWVSGVRTKLLALVPEFEGLRDLAKTASKYNINVEQAVEGAQACEALHRAGVEKPADVERFARLFQEEAVKKGRTAQDVIYDACRLHDWEEQSGQTVEEFFEGVEQKAEEDKRLAESAVNRRAEAAAAESERQDALQARNLTQSALDDFERTKDTIGERYFSELPKLRTMVENAKQTGYDVRQIQARLASVESLEQQERNLALRVQSKKDEDSALDARLKAKRSELTETQSLIDMAESGMKAMCAVAVDEIKRAADSGMRQFAGYEKAALVTDKRIASNLAKVDASVQGFDAKIQGLASSVAPSLEQLGRALDVLRQVGRLEAIAPLHKLLAGEAVPKGELLPVVVELLERLDEWFKTHTLSRTKAHQVVDAALSEVLSALRMELLA